MKSVIQLLYEAQDSAEEEVTAELEGLYQRERELFNKIHTALGLKMLDELNGTQAEIGHIQEQACFREGFRLGASLMLELLWESADAKSE